MDITSIIEIIIVIAVIYFLIKFVVSPVIKIILGIIIFLVAIYLLQSFFGFNIDQVLAPFGISLNLNKLLPSFNWILGPANYCIDQIKHFISFIWDSFPKSLNK